MRSAGFPKISAALIAFVIIRSIAASAAERVLTRSEILAIADSAIRAMANKSTKDFDCGVESWGVSVDHYNSDWTQYAKSARESFKGEAIRKIESQLSGRLYWAVHYLPLSGAAKTGGCFVFIDRDSGEVISTFADHKWQDQVTTGSESH